MASKESLTKRLKKLAEEVEKEGSNYKEATTNRTPAGNITLAFVEPLDG